MNLTDPPFACPPDTVLDIPVPLSVNETRRVNRAALPKVNDWNRAADMTLMASGQYRKAQKFSGPFEITIILDETKCRRDQDNIAKNAIDYVRRLGLVPDDSPKYLRRTVIEWGTAPQGCRIILKPAAGVE